MKTPDARELILKQTFLLLLEKGYDGVSITDIQKATGLSRGLLYHYFENKEILFSEVVRKYIMDLYAMEPGTENFDLPQMIASTIRVHERLCSVALSDRRANIRDYDLLFYRAIQEDESFARQLETIREQEQIAWRQAVGRSAAGGLLREGLDLDMAARSFIYLMDGIWMQAVHHISPAMLLKDIRQTLDSYFKLIVR